MGESKEALGMLPVSQPMEIQIWPIERLVFYARNPRKNDAAVDRMCSSIKEFGFKIPVLARSNGEVVDGHLRLKAARKLGSWPGGDTTCIPVILCDEWTDAQVKAFRLMVNRSVTWADWDEELLALELQELKETDFDLSLTGFEDQELARLLAEQDATAGLTDEDAIPDVSEAPLTMPSDLWRLGKDHKLLVGDATAPADVERLMAGDVADLVFIDPPYNCYFSGLHRRAPDDPTRPDGRHRVQAVPRSCVSVVPRRHQARRVPLRVPFLVLATRVSERAGDCGLRGPLPDHLGQKYLRLGIWPL